MQEKNTIEQLKSILAEREKRVKQLEDELSCLKENTTQYNTLNNQQYFINNDNIDSEFIRGRPPSSSLSNNNTFRGRSESANEKESTMISSSRQSLRSAKSTNPKNITNSLNAKTIDQKKEINIDYKLENNELKTLNKASEIERVRLTDLLKTLQKRIEELNEKILDYENKLNEQKRRCVNLEKQIERTKMQETTKNSASKNLGFFILFKLLDWKRSICKRRFFIIQLTCIHRIKKAS